MKNTTLLLCVLMSITLVRAQSPGGTSQTNLVWVKANSGTTPSTGSGSLSTWINSGSSGAIIVNGTPTFEEIGFNYNPKVHFNGDGNFLEHPGVIFGSIYAIVELEDLSRNYTHLSTWTNMCSGPNADGTLHGGINGGSSAFELAGYSPEFDGVGVWKRNGQDYLHDSNYSGSNELISAVANSGDMDTYGDRLMGGQPCLPSRDWLGDISEVIVLSGTSTTAERNQIESYLAIKYGLTLNNTAGGTAGDYFATTGTTIWDASLAPAYHNDVIGIGREDSESLNQKQSHTIDDVTRIYVGSLAATNAANLGSMSDFSYVMVGDNQGGMCATNLSNTEVPGSCGLYSRLEREWQVTRTSFTSSFNFDASLSACGIPGSVNTSHLRLLVDDDGDFSNGGTTCYFNGDGSGIVFSYSSPTITVSNISTAMIPNNTTRYITLGSTNPVTPLPIELVNFLVNCNQNVVELNWQTASESNSDYFTVERSRDGVNFEIITTVDAVGNSSSLTSYAWTDHDPISEISYYRLRQTDFDGSSEVFDMRSISCDASQEVKLYPVPLEDELKLESKYGGTLVLIDNMGKIVLSELFIAGTNSIQTESLSQGSYMAMIVFDNGEREVHKLIKI